MKKVFIFLAEGFEEGEFIIPFDVFFRAGLDITSVSISDSLNVISAHSVTIKADKLFTECDFNNGDLLFLPGGMPGTNNLNAYEPLKQLITDYYNKGKLVSAICAAPIILGGLGLLKGKKATCYPGFENKLIDANTTQNKVEVADNIITGKGVGAAFDFSLTLVSLLIDNETADKVKQQMMISD